MTRKVSFKSITGNAVVTKSNSFLKATGLLYGSVLIALLTLSIAIPRGADVLWINGNHSPFLDVIFRTVTHLGDGLAFLPVILILLFFKYYYSIVGAVAWAVHGIIAGVLKGTLYSNTKRPKAVIDNALLHFTEGVDVHSLDSFPSGHSATIFCMAVFISLVTESKTVAVIMLVIALVIGYSRIYLLQHFLIDVTGGAWIGAGTGFIVWYFFSRLRLPSWVDSKIKI